MREEGDSHATSLGIGTEKYAYLIDILQEKNRNYRLKKQLEISEKKDNSIQIRIQKIKVGILNINFTLTELF